MESKQSVCSRIFAGFFLFAVRRWYVSPLILSLVALLWSGRSFFDWPHCPSYGGFTHPDFKEVRHAFRQNILSGYDKGASFSVYYKGEALVDLWGGCADQDASKAWQRDTISQAWSSTKGVTAVVLGQLIDRGRLNESQTVAHYWPEFAQNGKENVTVAVLLSHQAGLSHLLRQVSLLEYRDNWTFVEELMSSQKPAWKPGTTYNYHAHTYGMYADALIRKVDEKHRNITQYFKEEIANPFNLDFHIGLPKELFYRSTRAFYTSFWGMYLEFLARPDNWPLLPSAIAHSHILYSSMKAVDVVNNFEVMNNADMRTVGLPSFNGFGTARSLAKFYDYVANNGTIKDKTLVTSKTVSVLSTPLTKNIPVILGPANPYSPLGTMVEPNRNGQPTVGHRGYGGQHGYGDMQYNVGVAYLTNYNHGAGDVEDPRLTILLDALYRCLEKFRQKSL